MSEQTQQIGEIIATVNDIATQSNMLALNASVETARDLNELARELMDIVGRYQ
jgi:hypothetical protein